MLIEPAYQNVILVDERGRSVGYADKLAAHQHGWLHRAFSIFVFNRAGQMLLQRRAPDKYHSAGLWSNACCSHFYPNAPTDVVSQRLRHEMGLQVALQPLFTFRYRTELDNQLIEHEYDHIYAGRCEMDPVLNPQEADAFQWLNWSCLQTAVVQKPGTFTPWLRLLLEQRADSLLAYGVSDAQGQGP